MADQRVTIQFNKIIKSLDNVLKNAVRPEEILRLAQVATVIIVRRTRLGGGVNIRGKGVIAGVVREPLEALSMNYVKQRKMFAGLSSSTRPKKSNLTRTGQMLASVDAKKVGNQVIIKPWGQHKGGFSNEQLAKWNEDGTKNRPRRVFLNISELEFIQIKRFYRKTFGDLVRSRK